MSVSGPSPLGTLMVQRVEAALGVTITQQANIATGARPDAVPQPGQPDKTDPTQNPPPKEQDGGRQAQTQGRQGGLAALARNDPEIAKLLAARNAPMTAYTASAPTTLGQAAKTILALLQQLPDARPAVTGRAPLLPQPPAHGGSSAAAAQGASPTAGGSAPPAASPVAGNLDPRAVEALMQRAGGGGEQTAAANTSPAAQTRPSAPTGGTSAPQQAGGTPVPSSSIRPGIPAPGLTAGGPLPAPSGMAGQLAHALSQALQNSGLFYESHLRDFAFGQRTLAQMRSEPQANAGRPAGGATPGGSAQAQGAGDTAAPQTQASQSGQPSQAQSSQAQSSQAQSSQAQSQAQSPQVHTTAQQTAQPSAHLAGALSGLDPSTHALVRQQLETLANQAFTWQGEAWPDGKLEWEVQRREAQGPDDGSSSWSTRLKLNLPGLGEVVARLSLADTQLVMHLSAPESASLMADYTGLLRERLNLHGLQLSQLTISRESEQNEGAQK